MFDWLRETWRSWTLRTKTQRRLQEQLLSLMETESRVSPLREGDDWLLLGSRSPITEVERANLRDQARRLVQENPHARNMLRLLEVYVAGPGLTLTAQPTVLANPLGDRDLANSANRLWSDFLARNRRHFSFREFARRTWRDGECFLRLFPQSETSPTVRFIDPEAIAATKDTPASFGILTDPIDVETVLGYTLIDPATLDFVETIPADELLHTRVGADSNQKRGVTIFAPVVDQLASYERWLETELSARKLQASIVLWRKVHGGPAQVSATAENARMPLAGDSDPATTTRREKYRPGTILTTSHGTDLQFLQPHTNFGDAVPLGRMLLLSIAAGAGVPEFMLTADASNGSFASTMVAEGPAVKLFESEQQFFATELTPLWEWVMRQHIAGGDLPDDFFDRIQPHWTFPQLVNRDRSKERLADVKLVQAGILSRAEVARRDNVDPAVMSAELTHETPAAG